MRRARADDAIIRDVIEWDVRNWSRALSFWQRYLTGDAPRIALAIGERGGGLSLWLASQGIRVVCTDFGVSLEPAKDLHRRHDVSPLVTYADLDVTSIDYPDASFDIVVFKSVLGALRTKERQVQAMNEIRRVLRPGGTLLFAENLVGSRLHAWLRSRFVPWDANWRYLDLQGDRDLFDGFGAVEFRTWGVLGLFGRSETQRDLIGLIDDRLSPLVPAGWRYIVFGACVRSRS
jgi:SAM-dependent methyltransferase